MKNQVYIENIINPFKKIITVSSDKSISIRCVLLSAIALGRSKLFNLLDSEDVLNSLKAIKNLGVKCVKKQNYLEVHGVGINGFKFNHNLTINAGNSGTLARCILGLCSATSKKIRLIGDQSLSKRDFKRIIEPLNLFGVNINSKNGMLPLTLDGTKILRPIKYIEKKGALKSKLQLY